MWRKGCYIRIRLAPLYQGVESQPTADCHAMPESSLVLARPVTSVPTSGQEPPTRYEFAASGAHLRLSATELFLRALDVTLRSATDPEEPRLEEIDRRLLTSPLGALHLHGDTDKDEILA